MHVVVLIGHNVGEEHTKEVCGNIQQALAEALAANLNMRQSSDVKCKYSLLPLYGETSLKEKLQFWIFNVLEVDEKIFFVVLGSYLASPTVDLLTIIHEIELQREESDYIYGIHFQTLTPMQAYFVKTELNSINTSRQGNPEMVRSVQRKAVVATGIVVEGKTSPVNAFPVLLYMVHLAIGENGERISGQGITPGVLITLT